MLDNVSDWWAQAVRFYPPITSFGLADFPAPEHRVQPAAPPRRLKRRSHHATDVCLCVVSVLQSLEQLHTQLSEVDVDYDEVESLSEGHKTALYASVALVKQMLSETQVGRQ